MDTECFFCGRICTPPSEDDEHLDEPYFWLQVDEFQPKCIWDGICHHCMKILNLKPCEAGMDGHIIKVRTIK